MLARSTLTRCWGTIGNPAPFLRRDNTPSRDNNHHHRNKSVHFVDDNTVYYTHSPAEYDRSPLDEPRGLQPILGEVYLSGTEHQAIQDPKQDSVVERNTHCNGRKNTQGLFVLMRLRSK